MQKPITFAGAFLWILCIGLTPFLINKWHLDPIVPTQFYFISIELLLILALSFFIIQKEENKGLLSISKEFITLLALFSSITALGLFSIINSINIPDALYALSKEILMIILLLEIYIWLKINPALKTKIPWIISLASTGFICISFLADCLQNFIHWPGLMMNTSVFMNKNLYAETLLLCLPFIGLSYWHFRNSKIIKIVLWLLFITSLVFIVYLRSRACFLSLLIGLLFIVVTYIIHLKKTKYLAYGFILILASGISFLFSFNKLNYFTHLTDVFSLQERWKIWSKTIQLWNNNFFIGWGLDQWKYYFPNANLAGFVPEIETGNKIFLRPHNDFIWIGSEHGLLAMILYVFTFIFSIYVVSKNYKAKRIPLFIYLCYIFFLLAYITLSFFGFPKERPFSIILLSIMLAFIYSDFIETKSLSIKTPSLAILFLIPCVYLSYLKVNSEKNIYEALHRISYGDHYMALKKLNSAQEYFFTSDASSTPILYHQAICHKALGQNNLLIPAILSAYQANPNHIKNLQLAGNTFLVEKNYLQAINWFSKLQHISSSNNENIVDLAIAYQQMGQPRKAYWLLKNMPYSHHKDARALYLMNEIEILIKN